MQMLGRRGSSSEVASGAGGDAGGEMPAGAMKTTQVSDDAPFDDDIPF